MGRFDEGENRTAGRANGGQNRKGGGMSESVSMEETFRRLFKIFDILHARGAKKMGRANLDLLVGLTYRQERALLLVGEGEKSGGLRQIDLARLLETTVPATSVLVDVMEKKELFVRTPSPDDRRAFSLRLTPLGRKTLRLIERNLSRLADELTEGVSPADREALIRVVAHFHSRLDGRK